MLPQPMQGVTRGEATPDTIGRHVAWLMVLHAKAHAMLPLTQAVGLLYSLKNVRLHMTGEC